MISKENQYKPHGTLRLASHETNVLHRHITAAIAALQRIDEAIRWADTVAVAPLLLETDLTVGKAVVKTVGPEGTTTQAREVHEAIVDMFDYAIGGAKVPGR